jgi:ParB family chromosome partitioning protein
MLRNSDRNTQSIPSLLMSVNANIDKLDETCLNISLLDAAPAEWNFYQPLGDDKMGELVDSIQSIGLMSPIVVWQRDNSRYMILSGHNRVHAFRIIYDKTQNNQYLSVPAKIICDIDEDTARQIIIDTNWVQRELSAIEKAKSIYEKYVSIAGNKIRAKKGDGRGPTVFDDIAKYYDIGNRMVQRYYRINFLAEPFQEMLKSGAIDLKSAEKLAGFEHETQMWIYNAFPSQLDNKTIAKLHNVMTKSEIENVFLDAQKLKHHGMYLFKMYVPYEKKDSFEAYVKNYFVEK